MLVTISIGYVCHVPATGACLCKPLTLHSGVLSLGLMNYRKLLAIIGSAYFTWFEAKLLCAGNGQLLRHILYHTARYQMVFCTRWCFKNRLGFY